MRYSFPQPASRGFSLVEVLVALIIVSVGLLGIAKMEALLLANTGVSRVRALVALEASSLAASMHADRDYWSAAPSGLAVTINPAQAATVSSADTTLGPEITAALAAPTICETGSAALPCTATQMAGYDLVQWEQAMAAVLGNAKTAIACTQVNNEIACTITISWTENTVNANRQETSSATAFQSQSYQLVVEP